MPKKYADKLYVAKMDKGYVLKGMLDCLAQNLSRATFTASKKGFFHQDANDVESFMFDVKFPREGFVEYYCRTKKQFSFNLKHFQRVIRTVRKKESLTMVIEKDHPETLRFIIQDVNGNGPSEFGTVQIKYIKEEDQENGFALPEYIDENGNITDDVDDIKVYDVAYVMDSKEFQKIKKPAAVSKELLIQIQGSNYMSVETKDKALGGGGFKCGEIQDPQDIIEEDSDEEYEIEDEEGESDTQGTAIYEASFQTKMILTLTKLPAICSKMCFYPPRFKTLPLRLSIQTHGETGSASIYIKDKIQIEFDKTEKAKYQALKMAN
jgi:hypothetical protein